MSPHKYIQAVDPVAVTIFAGVAAAFGSVISTVNAVLAVALVMLIAIDVVVGTAAAYLASVPGDEWYDWEKLKRGGVRKLILVCLVGTCVMIDVAGSTAFGELFEKLTPATKYGLAHGILAQVISIARNSSNVRELRPLAAFIMRRMDAARLGHEPPVRRDNYDPEAVAVEKSLVTGTGETFHDVVRRRDQEEA